MSVKKRSPNLKKKFRKVRNVKSFAERLKLLKKIIPIFIIIFIVGFIYFSIDKIFTQVYSFTGSLGFITKNITIEGQKYTSSEKIAKAMKVKPGMPILAISLNEIKRNLEKIDWIKIAIIERKLPSDIHVFIVERTPIALLQKERKLYLIDEQGVVINEQNIKPHIHLPIIIGEGAELYANILISSLKVDPDLFKHIYSIIRVNEHRWNVRFDNEIEVKLPEKDFDKAWEKVIKLYKKGSLFLPENAVIDLRIPNKIYIEKK